ncbi:MAG: APC family permease [Demequinaceae bacterium]|nr:APC family permease [Demequinaceae bacterium]
MLGAGVFVVWGAAASSAGRWLPAAVVLAAVVAVINAASTAQLAARHPVAGGAYAYGGRELGPAWGFVAGLGFVVGKIASVAAMALAIGAYVWPSRAPVVAVVIVACVWGLNARGVTRTAWATTVIAVVVLVGLAAVIVSSLATDVEHVSATSAAPVTVVGVASAAALIFFAFAGYARLATLGQEVRDPARTIPRAVAIAVALVVVVYLSLAVVLLRRPGVARLVGADAPLTLAVADTALWRSGLAALAAIAAGGALIALMAGIGRTAMAMARAGDLPRFLGRASGAGVPQVAEAAAGIAAVALAWWADLGFALAMSSVSVLTYYAIANAAAFAAKGRSTGFAMPRPASALGLVLCLALALSLDRVPTLIAIGVGVVSVAMRAVVIRFRRHRLESR